MEEEKKSLLGKIGDGIGGAFGWVGKHISNGVGAVKNWFKGVKNSADLGAISVLKKNFMNMIISFAMALHKGLVKEAKNGGKTTPLTGGKKDADVGTPLKNAVGEKSSEGVDKSGLKKSVEEKAPQQGKSVSSILDGANNKAKAIAETNKEFGMSRGNIGNNLNRQ